MLFILQKCVLLASYTYISLKTLHSHIFIWKTYIFCKAIQIVIEKVLAHSGVASRHRFCTVKAAVSVNHYVFLQLRQWKKNIAETTFLSLHNKTSCDYHISLQTKQNNISHYSAALTTVWLPAVGDHPANVNCLSQSRHQTTSLHTVNPQIQRFLEIRSLTVIFHNDSSNYYHPPLSFSCPFYPDIPSIINCHIMKFQQKKRVFFFTAHQSTLQSFQVQLKQREIPAV